MINKLLIIFKHIFCIIQHICDDRFKNIGDFENYLFFYHKNSNREMIILWTVHCSFPVHYFTFESVGVVEPPHHDYGVIFLKYLSRFHISHSDIRLFFQGYEL